MKKFLKKSIVAVAACATLLGSLSVSAAESTIGTEEQKVLDWIQSSTSKNKGDLYTLAEAQFKYTPGDITTTDAEAIKANLKKADDMVDKGATAEELVELANETAELVDGAVTLVDGEPVFVQYKLDEKGEPTDVINSITVVTDAKNTETVTDENGTGVFKTKDGKYYDLVEGGESVNVSPVDVTYAVHVQSAGDQDPVKNGASAGTTGSAKRLERITIKVEGNDDLGIEYTTHVQSYGWMPWAANGEKSGTEGEAKRLEAIKIRLTGKAADKYTVYYRVHAQSRDWMGWAKNGETAGTAGYAKRLEAIQIVVVPNWDNGGKLDESKYTPAKFAAAFDQKPGADNVAVPESVVPTVMYQTHVEKIGWQKWAANGAMAGTQGQYKRLEGIKLQLTNKDYAGSIEYSTHVEKIGWQAPVKDGQLAGTQGQKKRLEAIKINLTGEIANHYDVYYRVHAQSYGWMGWAKNGEEAGTSAQAKRLEGIQVVLVPKGGAAPASNYGGIQQLTAAPFVGK